MLKAVDQKQKETVSGLGVRVMFYLFLLQLLLHDLFTGSCLYEGLAFGRVSLAEWNTSQVLKG